MTHVRFALRLIALSALAVACSCNRIGGISVDEIRVEVDPGAQMKIVPQSVSVTYSEQHAALGYDFQSRSNIVGELSPERGTAFVLLTAKVTAGNADHIFDTAKLQCTGSNGQAVQLFHALPGEDTYFTHRMFGHRIGTSADGRMLRFLVMAKKSVGGLTLRYRAK